MFAWIYKINTKPDHNNAEKLNLIEFLSSPQNLTIHKGFPANETVNLKRKDLNWYVTDKNEWPAADFCISRLLGRLRHLQPINLLNIDEILNEGEKLSDYGLEEPNLKIDILSMVGKISLHFGNETRNNQQVYMMPIYENQKTRHIWAVNKSVKKAIYVPKGEWMQKEFLNIPAYNINSISLTTKSDETLLKTKFTKINPNTWKIITPIRATADSNAVRAFLSRLVSSRVNNFITADGGSELIKSSLENPLIKLKIEGKTKRCELIIGKTKDHNNGAIIYSAQIMDNNTTFSLDESFINFISNTENKLRNKRLFIMDPDRVSTLEVIKENNKLSMHKLENGRWEVLSVNNSNKLTSRPGDDKIINDFMETLNTFQILSFVNDTPSNDDLNSYGLNPPKQTVNIVSLNGDSYKLFIGSYSNTLHGYYAKSNISASVYTCPQSLQTIMDYSPKSFRLRLLDKLPASSIIDSINIIRSDQHSSIINIDRNSTKALENLIRSFKVKNIIQENFSKDGALIHGRFFPWEYKLCANISLPGRSNLNLMEVNYFFTNIPNSYGFIGGSPKTNTIFTIPDDRLSTIIKILKTDSNLKN